MSSHRGHGTARVVAARWILAAAVLTTCGGPPFSTQIDGSWSGLTAQGRKLTFEVEGASARNLALSAEVSEPGASCSVWGQLAGGGGISGRVLSGSASIPVRSIRYGTEHRADGSVTWRGTFESDHAISGELELTVQGEAACRGSVRTTWKAKRDTWTTAQQAAVDALVTAIEKGDEARAMALLPQVEDLSLGQTSSLVRPLEAAARQGRLDLVRLLLQRGASPRAASTGSLLEVAAEYGQADVVHALLDAGAPIEHTSALVKAAQHGHAAVVRVLLDAGVDPNSHPSGRTPLLEAAAGGHLEVIRLLLAAGVDTGYEDWGKTAEQTARANGHVAAARLIAAAVPTPLPQAR